MSKPYKDSVKASSKETAPFQTRQEDVIDEVADIVRLLVRYTNTLHIMSVLLRGLDERMKYLTQLKKPPKTRSTRK